MNNLVMGIFIVAAILFLGYIAENAISRVDQIQQEEIYVGN